MAAFDVKLIAWTDADNGVLAGSLVNYFIETRLGGVLTAPGNLTLLVKQSDGTSNASYSLAALTTDAPGQYHIGLAQALTFAGVVTWTWTATLPVAGVASGKFYVGKAY